MGGGGVGGGDSDMFSPEQWLRGCKERGIKPIANVLSELCKCKCLWFEGRNSILRVHLPPTITSHILLTEEKT